MKTVGELVAGLLQLDQDMPVFIRLWVDRETEDYLKLEPLWERHIFVETVEYPMPHIGGYYGKAVVIGDYDDEA